MILHKQAIAFEPDYAQAYSSMAVIELKLENDSSALRYAKKAYELDNTDPVITANLAIVYHYNNDVPNRDRMADVAASLHYHNMESLRKIFDGELTIRD